MRPGGHGEPGVRRALRLRSDDGVEVGIIGDDIVVRRAGWLCRMAQESFPPRLQEVLMVVERWLPIALATAHYAGGVLRIYRLGQPWLVLEGVSDHYVAIDFAAECRRFRP